MADVKPEGGGDIDESLGNLPALKGKGRDKKVEYLSLVFDLRGAAKDFN